MCFSATVSFASAGVITIIGGVSLKQSLAVKHYLLLSLTPFLFALQQVVEGFVWIDFKHQDYSSITFFSSAYLFFALSFWIVWFPIVAYSLESVKQKKWFFAFLTLVGVMFGLYFWLPTLFGLEPRQLIQTNICKNSLCYHVASGVYLPEFVIHVFQFIYVFFGFLYLLCSDTVFKKFWTVVMIFAIITRITFEFAWTSVWCFFSALASLYIIYLIQKASLKQHAAAKTTQQLAYAISKN